MLKTLRWMTALVAVTALAACDSGGGGGGGGDDDILGGAGNFEAEAAQGSWNVQGAGTNEVELWGPCASGSTCANLALSDYGDNDYSSQLAYWDAAAETPTFKTVTLRADRQYVIRLWGAAEKAGDPAGITYPVSVWLQATDFSGTYGTLSLELPAAGELFTSEPFTLGSATEPVQANVVINMGPESTNSGVTFHFDDFEILEQPKPPPPPGTDLLGGMGAFDDAAQQGNWHINKNSAVTGDVTLAFEPCTGMTGGCAVISSTEGFGTTNWHTQLAFGAGAFEELTTLASEQYRIAFKGKVEGCTTPGPVAASVWAQSVSIDWPPLNDGATAITFTSSVSDVTTGVFSGQDVADVRLVFNFGGTEGNAGCVFTLDDIQFIQVD